MLNRMLLFAQVRCQRGHVVAPPLQFDVMTLFDAVHAHVDLRARRRGARHLFAQKEIGVVAKMLGGVDGIVIGDRHQIHATPLQGPIDGLRIVVALAAKTVEPGNVAHARVPRMDVQIAPHGPLYPACSYSRLNCGKNIRDRKCTLITKGALGGSTLPVPARPKGYRCVSVWLASSLRAVTIALYQETTEGWTRATASKRTPLNSPLPRITSIPLRFSLRDHHSVRSKTRRRRTRTCRRIAPRPGKPGSGIP